MWGVEMAHGKVAIWQKHVSHVLIQIWPALLCRRPELDLAILLAEAPLHLHLENSTQLLAASTAL